MGEVGMKNFSIIPSEILFGVYFITHYHRIEMIFYSKNVVKQNRANWFNKYYFYCITIQRQIQSDVNCFSNKWNSKMPDFINKSKTQLGLFLIQWPKFYIECTLSNKSLIYNCFVYSDTKGKKKIGRQNEQNTHMIHNVSHTANKKQSTITNTSF